MGFLDNIREEAEDAIDKGKDALDKVKDEAEERTGVDIDRDGNVGDSGGGSSDSGSSDTGSSSDSSSNTGSSSDSVDVSVGGGSDGGGSSSSGSSDVVETIESDANQPVNVEDIDIPDRSNEDFSQEGPEKVAVQSSVTVEDKQTSVRTESGNEITRAEAIQRRDEAEQRRRNLENQEEFLQNLSEGSRVRTQGGEVLSRSQALNQVSQRAEDAFDTEQSIRTGLENFNQISRSQRREPRDVFDIAREKADVERPLSFNNPFNSGNDFGDIINVNEEGVEDFFDNPGDQTFISGTELMQSGQDFADDFIDDASEFKAGFDRAVIEANPLTTFQPNTQQSLRRGVTPEDAIESIGRGVATGGSQAPGLLLATPGAVSRSFQEDTPSLSQGAAKGGSLFVEEAENDPIGLVGEEIGEEISEKAIFGTAGAVAGKTAGRSASILGAAPTPDFNSLRPAEDGFSTVKGSASFGGITDDSATPDFVSDTGPDTLEPDIGIEQDVTGTDIEAEPDIVEADTNIESSGGPVSSPFSDVGSAPIDNSIDETFSDIFAEVDAEADPFAESEARADPLSDVFADATAVAEVEPEVDPRLDPRPDTRLDRSLDPTLGGQDDEEELLFGNDSADQVNDDFRFQSSVGAEILGITAEERPDAQSIQDPFSVRPIVTENEDNRRDDERIL